MVFTALSAQLVAVGFMVYQGVIAVSLVLEIVTFVFPLGKKHHIQFIQKILNKLPLILRISGPQVKKDPQPMGSPYL